MDIHDRIKQLCEKNKWSLSKLAKEAGLSETTVYDWYNENHFTPSRKAIDDVCSAFDITLSEFYSDIELDKLTEKEIKLLEVFKKVPIEKQDVVIIVAQALKNE